MVAIEESGAVPAHPDAGVPPPPVALDEKKNSISGAGTPGLVAKTPGKGRRKKAQAATVKYALRSSGGSVRVLRPRSSEGKKETPPPAEPSHSRVEKGSRRKKRKVKMQEGDEFARMRLRVAYYLRRMNYEQSLVDAYAAEGWRGQSLEKIRPEKELERAKSEIIRCKLKIRELLQQLDSLLLEGKLEDSLFDSDGQIDSEDIFCAKCGSKDLCAGNDIILCDGVCNRGFHQKCLMPPLLNEDIPSGDEAWLCPGCDCKIECIDLVNEFQGTNLSIEDEWKKVFPEASASADKRNLLDDMGLPSDDSEDDDFAPDDSKVDVGEQGSESSDSSDSSEDSGFTSEDSDVPNNGFQNGDIGLPSDDSEDDDYDPEKPVINKRSESGTGSDMAGAGSDESDFSSDSEGSGALGYNSLSPSRLEDGTHSSEIPSLSAELLSLKEPDLFQDPVATYLEKRKRKLMDDDKTDDADSDSDDGTWTDDAPKKLRREVTRKDSSRKRSESHKNRCKSGATGVVNVDKSSEVLTMNRKRHASKRSQFKDCNLSNFCDIADNKRSISMKSDNEKLENAIENPSADLLAGPLRLKTRGGSSSKFFGKAISERLLESFKAEQYPTADVKRDLAQELGITYKQVDRWFVNARHSFRASGSAPTALARSGSKKDTPRNRGKMIPTTIDGTEQLSPISKMQNAFASSPGLSGRDLEDAGSSQTAARKKKVVTDREKLVLRELRKLKRGH